MIKHSGRFIIATFFSIVLFSMFAACSSARINPSTSSDVSVSDRDSAIEIAAMHNDAITDTALVKLCDYQILSTLPAGVQPSDNHYDEEYNREHNSYTFDSRGNISEGYNIVQTTIELINTHDYDITVNVGSLHISSFDTQGNNVSDMSAGEPLWIETDKRQTKDYYNYQIPSNRSIERSILFAIQHDTIECNDSYLVVSNKRIGKETKDIQAFTLNQ